jgi:hypothetical protein
LFGSSLNKPKVSGFGEDPTSTEKNYW